MRDIIEKLKLNGPETGGRDAGKTDQNDAARIHEITCDELQNFRISPSGYIDLYRSYQQGGCLHAARAMLGLFLRESFFDGPEIHDILNRELFELDDQGSLAENIGRVRSLMSRNSGKPRVTLFSLVWVRGGMERVLSLLSGYLSKTYDVVIISDFNDGQGFPLPSGVTAVMFRSHGEYASRLADLIGLIGTDVFVGNPNHMIEFLPVYEKLHEQNIRTIASNHMNYFLPLQLRWLYPVWKKRREVYRKINCAVWPVRISTCLHSNAIAKNAVCIPNPATFEPISPSGEKEHNTNVLVVGRFDDTVKRFDRVLTVFKQLSEMNTECTLTVVGRFDPNWHIPNESSESLGEMMGRLEIPRNRITFVGETDNIQENYRNSSVLLMTSESECFPMVLLEARAHGVPPVVFDFPGVEDIVTDGINGIVVRQGDIDDMAGQVNRVLTDEPYFRNLSENARRDMERFSINVVGKMWNDLIRDVLTGDHERCLSQKNSERNTDDTDPQECGTSSVRAYEESIAKLLADFRDYQEREPANAEFSFRKTNVYRGLRLLKRTLFKVVRNDREK